MINITIAKGSLYVFFFLLSLGQLKAQYKTIDFEISMSPYSDDRLLLIDEYDFESIFGMTQFGVGYSTSINQHWSLSPKMSIGLGRESYIGLNTNSGLTRPDDILEINRRALFLKIGAAATYWFDDIEKGFYAETEIQNIIPISAVSTELYLNSTNSFIERKVDYKDELKSYVPSLRLGIGYNLTYKKVILFARVGIEFRLSTYFNNTDNYTWVNRSLGFGLRYALGNGK